MRSRLRGSRRCIQAQSPEVLIVQREYVIEHFAPNAAHPALRQSILPTLVRIGLMALARRLHNIAPELGVMVEQDVDKDIEAAAPRAVAVRSSRWSDAP